MIRTFSRFLAVIFLFGLSVVATSQESYFGPVNSSSPTLLVDGGDVPQVPIPPVTPPLHAVLPVMSPELALQVFESRGQRQAEGLQGYTDDTLVIAELVDTSQRGAFELQRAYVAPHSLKYTPINFTGDAFVKSNVITHVLQSEVDYVEKGDPSQTALTIDNYKFSFKGDQQLNGHMVYAYQVKPLHKRAGLFKGHVYLDAHTGGLLRSEGTISKSPSFFVRKIEFVEDSIEINHFIFPTHLHTTAQARLLGKVVLDVYHRDFQPQSLSASFVSTAQAGQP